jgi:hypothetical protein
MTRTPDEDIWRGLARHFDAIGANGEPRDPRLVAGGVRQGPTIRRSALSPGGALIAALVTVAIVGWAVVPRGSQAPTGGVPMVVYDLPTTPPNSNGGLNVCLTALLSGVLQGSPEDARFAWVIAADGLRVDVDWPPGFRVRFSDALELLDQSGSVVARGGDELTLGGGTSPSGNSFGVCSINGTTFGGPSRSILYPAP